MLRKSFNFTTFPSSARLCNFWVFETFIFGTFGPFGPSGFRYPGVHYAVTPHLLSFQMPNSEIPIYFTLRAHIAQWSPPTTVARGTFMRVHVAFNDVIGSHLSRFSSRPTGTWYISMCPRPFLEKSDGQIFLRSTAQILSGFWLPNADAL
jgi:hypothetical protein